MPYTATAVEPAVLGGAGAVLSGSGGRPINGALGLRRLDDILRRLGWTVASDLSLSDRDTVRLWAPPPR